MANLTANEILLLKQAFVTNDKDDTLTERVKNLINNDTTAFGATFSIAAEAANAITVSVQLTDPDGDDVAVASVVRIYTSSDSAGQALRNPPTTAHAAGTDGTLLSTDGTLNVQNYTTEADGDLDIVITDASGAQTYYLNVVLPTGKIVTSSVITFAA